MCKKTEWHQKFVGRDSATRVFFTTGNHGGYSYAIYKRMGEIMEKYKLAQNGAKTEAAKEEARLAARKEIEELQEKARSALHREKDKIELVASESEGTQRRLYEKWAKEFGVQEPGEYVTPSGWPNP